jgi:hypothetical protein
MTEMCRDSRGRDAQRVPAFFVGFVAYQHFFPAPGGRVDFTLLVGGQNDDLHNYQSAVI